MLSKELEYVLNQAFRGARESRHEFVTVEHLLLALLGEPAAAKVFSWSNRDAILQLSARLETARG